MKRLTVVCLLLVAFTACGGGSDDSNDGNQAQEEPAASPSPTTDEEPTDQTASDSCLNAPRSKTKVELTQVDVAFKPRSVEVPAGETVTLVVTNKGALEHTFTSDVLGCDSGFVTAQGKKSLTFEMPNKPVPFYCIPHKDIMKGKLIPT